MAYRGVSAADRGVRSGPVLAVDADLQLQVTTPAGASSAARLTGHGEHLTLEAGRPEVLLDAVDRADVAWIADVLVPAGITVTVSGPHGPVATLGARAPSSRVGRLLTGSPHLAPIPAGAPGALRRLIAARSTQPRVAGDGRRAGGDPAVAPPARPGAGAGRD